MSTASPVGRCSAPNAEVTVTSMCSAARWAGTCAVSMQDVAVAFIVAAPGAVGVAEKDGDLADEAVWCRQRSSGNDGPVIARPAQRRRAAAGLAVGEVTDVDCQ